VRIEGTLTKWNDERGFGFISPNSGGPEVFVHVSAFPQDGRRPVVGERVEFDIEIVRDGKNRAAKLLCLSRAPRSSPGRPSTRTRDAKGGGFRHAITLAVAAGLAFYGYSEYSRQKDRGATVASLQSERATIPLFRCDGRTHCTEMTSCEEATFFLKSCPNVAMDGDHDGVPCEQQWCSD
jgi:cold shock CspA family protein